MKVHTLEPLSLEPNEYGLYTRWFKAVLLPLFDII